MLDRVILQSASAPKTLNLTGVDPDEILILKSISGLAGAKVNQFLGDFSRDGGYYQGRRADKLNPVFNFKMNPDYKNDVDVSQIREMLYLWFFEPSAYSDGLKVLLDDDRRPDRYFIAYAEDMNTDQWQKEQTCQVSTIAVDPYLRSDAETSGADAAGWAAFTINYDGTAKTGMSMTLKVKTANPTIVVYNGNDRFILDGPFAVNDIVTVNTSIGSRSIKKNGVDAMGMWRAGSKWLQLHNGQNNFVIYGTAAGDGRAVMMDYKYRSAWWGI